MAHELLLDSSMPTCKQQDEVLVCMNSAPAGFDAATNLPPGFLDFLMPLHRALTPRQQKLIAKRAQAMRAAQAGKLPEHLPPSGFGRTLARQFCRRVTRIFLCLSC